MSRIITLTTDFGTRDAYVGAMKGAILAISPHVRLVDVTHDVAPQDVMEAAYVLKDAAFYFPPETIHLIVVDPGVGTARRAVALKSRGHYFVGPDNGLFPLLLGDEVVEQCVQLDRKQFWRAASVSTTFHGRDIFAPAAAHLSRGVPIDELGSPVESLTPLHWALPIADDEGVRGWIVHIDRFGNCITNISREILDGRKADRPVKCFVGSAVLETMAPTYAAVESGEPLMHYNSSGVLEIAVNTGNAAELLGIRKGDRVNIVFRDQK